MDISRNKLLSDLILFCRPVHNLIKTGHTKALISTVITNFIYYFHASPHKLLNKTFVSFDCYKL